MDDPTVVVVGTGALAQTVCRSLAALPDVQARVIVVGRNPERAAQVARSARMGGHVRVAAHPAGTDEASGLAAAAATYRPSVVIQCASWYATGDTRERSAWSVLLAEAGLGITLPLQAVPVGLTAALLQTECHFLNGCFPDAVNVVLAAQGLPVLCGIGNASTLWGYLADPAMRLLAHHVHLHHPARPDDEARAWKAGEPVTDLTERLSALRALPKAQLNEWAGPPAAHLVRHLLTGEEMRMSVPGPLGQPGGYPVLVRDGRLSLDLPSGISDSDAVGWNQRMAERDGVIVDPHGRVTFGHNARLALERYLPSLASGFDLDALPMAASQLLRLRDRLRAMPADVGRFAVG